MTSTVIVTVLWLQASSGTCTVTGNAWHFSIAAYYVQKENGLLYYEYYQATVPP